MAETNIKPFNPESVRSFKILDTQKNVTMFAESRPFKVTGSRPFIQNYEGLKETFKNAYEEYFGWRSTDHFLFVENMTIALRNTFAKIGPVSVWVKSNRSGRDYGIVAGDLNILRIIRNKGDIYSDDRLVSLYHAYGQSIYEELCIQIRSMSWRVDSLFEGPLYLMKLAQAHLNAAVFTVGKVALEITQYGIDKLSLTAKIRVKLYEKVDNTINKVGVVKVTNEALEKVSGVLSKDKTSIGHQIVDTAFDKPYETFVEFSKDEVKNMIMDYQSRRGENPDLTVEDPIDNPLIEQVIGLYAPAALAYNATKVMGNTLYHCVEAHSLKKQAYEHMQFLIDEDRRGQKQGKGRTIEVNKRRDAILQDMESLKMSEGGFISKLIILSSLFLKKDHQSLVDWWISTPTGITNNEALKAFAEDSKRTARQIKIADQGEWLVEAEEDWEFTKDLISEGVGQAAKKTRDVMESVGDVLGGALDELNGALDELDDMYNQWRKERMDQSK